MILPNSTHEPLLHTLTPMADDGDLFGGDDDTSSDGDGNDDRNDDRNDDGDAQYETGADPSDAAEAAEDSPSITTSWAQLNVDVRGANTDNAGGGETKADDAAAIGDPDASAGGSAACATASVAAGTEAATDADAPPPSSLLAAAAMPSPSGGAGPRKELPPTRWRAKKTLGGSV